MASNLTRSWPTHQDWIKETYVHGEVSRQTQQWVDDWVDAHPGEELTVDTCTQGLLGILDTAPDGEPVHLSWHLSVEAFDCQPGVGELSVLEGIVDKKTDFGASAAKLLTEEGGETRWHSANPLAPFVRPSGRSHGARRRSATAFTACRDPTAARWTRCRRPPNGDLTSPATATDRRDRFPATPEHGVDG
jgi:hypothetical protein